MDVLQPIPMPTWAEATAANLSKLMVVKILLWIPKVAKDMLTGVVHMETMVAATIQVRLASTKLAYSTLTLSTVHILVCRSYHLPFNPSIPLS